jgi:hypothetical protein
MIHSASRIRRSGLAHPSSRRDGSRRSPMTRGAHRRAPSCATRHRRGATAPHQRQDRHQAHVELRICPIVRDHCSYRATACATAPRSLQVCGLLVAPGGKSVGVVVGTIHSRGRGDRSRSPSSTTFTSCCSASLAGSVSSRAQWTRRLCARRFSRRRRQSRGNRRKEDAGEGYRDGTSRARRRVASPAM